MRKLPSVNEVNEFLEIASDFEDPLEVIRESLSNSYDADATEVSITIKKSPEGSDIIIEDDGHGMNRADLESFFDLGNSSKTDSIGYKGHGTKIFYKSDRIVVNTASEGTNLRAVMEKPWEKLNRRELPEYEIAESETRRENSGTRIRIRGFKSGSGFAPKSLTYNKIHHYLKWKTIAGSTAHFFDPENFREMDIRVRLDDEIDDSMDVLKTTNKLEFPEEQLEPAPGKFPARRMLKVYSEKELEVHHENGTSTIQIVGMVGGKEARNELPTFGKHSAQFGVWLAKDHIKVERVNDAIAHDNEYIHFFFVANSQDLELSANRGKIRNKASPEFQAIKEKVSYYLSKVTSDPWFKDYLKHRKRGEIHRKAATQNDTIEERLQRVQKRQEYKPNNRTEVLLGLEKANNLNGSDISVEEVDLDADVQALVSFNGDLMATSVHQQLTEHFDSNQPLESIDAVVCWEYGDRDKLREYQYNGYHGNGVELDWENNTIYYENTETHEINVYPLKEIFSAAKTTEVSD